MTAMEVLEELMEADSHPMDLPLEEIMVVTVEGTPVAAVEPPDTSQGFNVRFTHEKRAPPPTYPLPATGCMYMYSS